MANIQPPREEWIITNLTDTTISLLDLPSVPILTKKGTTGATVDLMRYATSSQVSTSNSYRNLLNRGQISTLGYQHTHDDRAWADHTHTGLSTITGGPESDADVWHTHNSLTTVLEVNSLISSALNGLNIDLTEYVRKDESINQLSDITSDGLAIENAVFLAHEEQHKILSHLDNTAPYLVDNYKKLVDGSNADSLHTHVISSSSVIHNSLSGLQGGTLEEYYHLTEEQNILVARLGEDSAGLTFDGDSIGGNGGVTVHSALTGLSSDDHAQYLLVNGGRWMTGDLSTAENINIYSNTSRIYLGKEQETFIYYDGTDLQIGFSNPSAGDLDQVIRINDDLTVEGILTVGTNSVSVVIDGESITAPSIVSTGTITNDSGVKVPGICLWAEETANLSTSTDGGIQFAFGNGNTGGHGVCQPASGVIYATSIAWETGGTNGDGTIDIAINGVAQGVTLRMTVGTGADGSNYYTDDTGIAFNAGDDLTFITTGNESGGIAPNGMVAAMWIVYD